MICNVVFFYDTSSSPLLKNTDESMAWDVQYVTVNISLYIIAAKLYINPCIIS